MKTILIIDDDANIRNVFQRFLERNGYEVILAADGKEGLRLVTENKPDLILTDIMMPETDGLEVLMTIRNMEERPPIIAFSGGMRSATMDFLPLAKKLGASKVLYKPVELDQLLAEVNAILPAE